jgi:hypothetical protein
MEAGVEKFAVVLARFLIVCAPFLAFPTSASAQPAPLDIRLWTQNAGGDNQITFSPGETIQFVAELNSSCGFALSADMFIVTDFYEDTSTVEVPTGISTWTWATTAPSEAGDYLVSLNVSALNSGESAATSAAFTVTAEQSQPPQPPPEPPLPTLRDPGESISQPVYPSSSARPQGQAPNLIVLVHGCCTNEDDVNGWRELGSSMLSAITNAQPDRAWEIVVLDWSFDTPKHDYDSLGPVEGLRQRKKDATTAYNNAFSQGWALGRQIAGYHIYEYVHLIAHSAGSNLIQSAIYSLRTTPRIAPLVHATFLDAFATNGAESIYGAGAQYAEHYVNLDFLALPDANTNPGAFPRL